MNTEVLRESSAPLADTRSADEFAVFLKQSFKPRNERAAAEVENAVTTLVEEALRGTDVVKDDVLDTIESIIARLDEKLTKQVNAILHAPEFQQIESAWRGLNYLIENSETDANLKIRVMNVSKHELYESLRYNRGAKWDQSPLFTKIYEQEFGQLGGEPYGALVGDYYFSHQPTDVQLMRDLCRIAAAAHAPLFAAADPTLLGLDDWNELMRLRDLSKVLDTPDYAPWKSLRESPDSRYLGLCLPRVLARVPYGAKSEPVEDFAFEEETDGHDGRRYAWMNAAYAMAVNVNRAFKEYGWCTKIRGVESGGEVVNLPTHTFPTDDGGLDMKCPTEVAVTDRREAELAKSGLIPLVHRKNTDKAAFLGAQSIYRPQKKDTADGTASDALSARLPYMFAVSRFAHYLKCMVRDKVGSLKETDQLQRWLSEWIAQYVDPNPATSSEIQKSRQPLAAAEIRVEANEENPGYYNATFHLRPHYQLEGMEVGMTLVSRLPSGET